MLFFRVCPCILLFTLSTLPQIWMLELDMMEEKQRYQEESVISAVEVAIEMQRQVSCPSLYGRGGKKLPPPFRKIFQ